MHPRQHKQQEGCDAGGTTVLPCLSAYSLHNWFPPIDTISQLTQLIFAEPVTWTNTSQDCTVGNNLFRCKPGAMGWFGYLR
jgi:hypothetical protein